MMFNDLFGISSSDSSLTPISKYVIDGVLNIDAPNWSALNKEYTKEELIEFLVTEVTSGNMKFPYREITLDDARNDFVLLSDSKPEEFEYAKVCTRFDYTYPIQDKYIKGMNVGNLASDYFQQKNRFKCEGHGNPSPIRTWNTPEFLYTLFKALWTLKCTNVNSSTIRTIIALRKYTASQFKPSVAKTIYEKYNSQDVIDFSAGWGDRLCGFYATKHAKSYIGIDPNTDVYKCYFTQANFYKGLTTPKEVTFINQPAEEVVLGEEIADTIFTSPPYFNAEKYTTDSTQSFKRYKTIDSWLTGFMFPTLTTMCKALKVGGHLIINISDVYTNGTRHKICDPMNDFLSQIDGMEFVEAYGMKMAKRPNSLADDGNPDTTFIEPVWVWTKTKHLENG